MYKAIIFDFWGVFYVDPTFTWFRKRVPNYERVIAGLYELSRRHDYGEVSRLGYLKEISKLTGIPLDEVIRGVDEVTLPILPMVTLAEELRKFHRLALISNGNDEWINPALKKSGLEGTFDPLVVSANVGMIKPHRDIFDYTLEKLRLSADEVVFVDDREANVTAAESYGIKSLLFTRREKLVENLSSLGFRIS